MEEEPEISVVIPALNAAATLGQQLDALLAQTVSFPFEVLVADNGSADRTVNLVHEYVDRDDRVRFVDAADRPKGGAAAKNAGAERARSDLLAFCDADDLVAPGWLQAMYDALQRSVVVVCTREYGKLNGGPPQTRAGYVIGAIPGISGGAFGIHRDLYLQVGGFDPHFRGAVDTEFAARLFRATGTIPAEVPDAVIHVRQPSGLGFRFRRSRALARSIPLLEQNFPELMPTPTPIWRKAVWLAMRGHWLVLPDRRRSWVSECGRLVGLVEGRIATRHTRPQA